MAPRLPARSSAPKLLRRPRLERLLTGRWKLAVLSAPAGYGKTTLAAQIAGRQEPLWCRLHAEDRDPAQLLGSLLTAGARLSPPVGERTFRLFASKRDMERDGGLLTASFLDELGEAGATRRSAATAARRRERLVVLDDAHVIADAREATQWLTRLIEESGPRVRFLLTCRGPCPLPLARFALQGGTVVVGVHELEFTVAEQKALMRSGFGLHLEPAEMAALRQTLGGWVAGLVLAAQHVRRTGQAPGYDATLQTEDEHRLGQLVSFLAEEVYAPLPARLRRALCRASVLEELIPEAVRFILGESEGNYLLREIARRDLFVRTLPDGASAPRFHPLFSDYLRKRLAVSESETERRRLRHRLAHYWMRRDQTAKAIRALSEAGSLDQAVRLFDRTAAGLAARRGGAEAKHPSLGALASELGKGVLDSDRSLESPWVLLHSAYGERDAGRFDEANRRARSAEQRFLAQGASLSAVRAFRVETVTAVMTGRVRDPLRQGRWLLNRIPLRERVARGILNVQLSRLLLYAGQPERSRSHAADGERLLRGAREPIELAEASLQIATVAFTEGRWDVYLALARQALAVFRRAGYIGRMQTLLINMAEACIYLGEEMKAIALLDEARAQHAVSGLSFHRSGEAIGRARALSEHGDLAEAHRMFKNAREAVRQFGTPMAALQLEVWDGVLERRRRRLKQARVRLDRAVDGFERAESPSWLTLARMERALVRGLEGDTDEALGELKAMAETSRRLGDRKELARNWLYEARVLQAAGRESEPPLLRALGLLDREDYLVLLRKESDLTLPLLAAARAQQKKPQEKNAQETKAGLIERAIAALPDPLRARIAAPMEPPPDGRRRRKAVHPAGRVQSAPRPQLHVRLLGAFAVRAEERDLDFPRRASEAMVALLALNHGQAVGWEALAEALWPGAPAGASRNRFDVALSTARRVLEPEAGARGPFRILVTEAGMCRLAGAGVSVDVEEFEQLAAAGEPCLEQLARRRWSRSASFSRSQAERELGRLKRAVSAYTGDLLPGWPYAAWTEEERARLRDRHHRLLLGVAALAHDLGRAEEAADAARRVLADDPLHEEAERLLLQALAARGEKGALLKSYRTFVRRLERELGTPPSPETTALYRELTAPSFVESDR